MADRAVRNKLGRRVIPRAFRAEPDLVFFDAWRGRYADNPRGIFEELRRRGASLRYSWLLDGSERDVPAGTAVVRPDRRGHLEALGRAGFIVANSNMPGYFHKKRGTVYLQTWHGTPLKRIAFDIAGSFENKDGYLRLLRRDVAAWDYLVSPNAFSSEVLRRAFGFDGEVLETGYPRNDLLAAPERQRARAEIRAALKIAPHRRAILYAPTYRDDRSSAMAMDLDRLLAALDPDDVILVRGHFLEADTGASASTAAVADLTDYPDVRDLLLAADVLITDYSSLMFDFAITAKPMLFFTHDLERYRDRMRGFYFDFEAQAPGPLLRSTDDVIAALRELDAIVAEHASAYARFRERFCELEDGRAAQRVVDAVFGG